MINLETIFLVLIMLLLAFSIRMVGEHQRIALFRFGRFTGLKGPGVVMVVPFMDRECKVTVGDRGELLAGGMGKFREFQLPVVVSTSLQVGVSIKVIGFTKDGLLVA